MEEIEKPACILLAQKTKMRSQRSFLVIFTSLLVAVCSQACIEDDPVCRPIGKRVCAPPLDSFGKAHCGIFCEYCSFNETSQANETTHQSTTRLAIQPTASPDDCGVDDPICRELGHQTVCVTPFLDFAKRKCRIFCEFCLVNDSSAGQDTITTSSSRTTTDTMQTTTTEMPRTRQATVTHVPFIGVTTRQTTENTPSTPPPLTTVQLTTEAHTTTPTSKPGHWLFQDCNTTAEVVFVLDSSSSVGDANFQKVLEFTQRVTERLKTKYERLNITVITYSNDAKVVLRLNESMDLSSLLTAEGNISYSHGGTQTHKAIELMYKAFSHDTKNPKIAVVITDGASFEPAQTRNASQYAKDHGVAIFAIGVGEDVNSHEIMSISSDPDAEFLFRLNNFAALSSIVQLFHSRNCQDFTTNSTTTEQPRQPVSEQTPTLEPGKLGSTVKPSAIPPFHTPQVVSPGTQTPSSVSVHTPVVKPTQTRQTKKHVPLTQPVTPVVVPMETTSTSTHITVTAIPVTVKQATEASITVTDIPVTVKQVTEAPNTVTIKQATEASTTITDIPVTTKQATEAPSTVTDIPVTAKQATEAPITVTAIPFMVKQTTEAPTTVTDIPVTARQTTEAPTTVTDIPVTARQATEAPTTVMDILVTVRQATEAPPITVTDIPITFKPVTDAPTIGTDPPDPVTITGKITTPDPVIVTDKITSPDPVTVTDKLITPDPATTIKKLTTPDHVTTTKKLNTPAPVTTMKKLTTPEPVTITKKLTTPDPVTITDKITTPDHVRITKKLTTPYPATTMKKLTTPDPVTITKKLTTPDPVMITKKITTPDPVTITKKITTPDPVMITKKIATPDPVTITKKLTTPDPVTITKKIATPDPVTTTQKLTTPDPATTMKKLTTPDPVTITKKIATPDHVTTTQKLTTPDPVTVTDKATTPDPVTTTQKLPTPDPVTITKKLTTPDPVTITKKLTTPDPVTVTDKATPPDLVTITDKVTTPDPVTVTDKITTPDPVTIMKKITTPDHVTITKKLTTPNPVTVTVKIATPKPITTTEEIKTPKQSTTTAPITSSRPETTTTARITSTEQLSTTTASCIAKVADVIFVIDSSGSIGLDNFQKVKSFMKDVIRTFDVDSLYTRVALIEYSTVAHIEFKLNDKTNLTELLDAVDSMGYSGGGTATSDALRLMRTEGFGGERPDAPDVAIVITDGLSKFPALTRTQANLAKADEITLFSIGIGNLTDRDELLAIASDRRFLFEVGSFEALRTLDAVVAHIACGVVLPEMHHTRGSTTPSTTPAGCVDLSANCASYPRDSCTDFEPYARKNCARTCGYCPGFPLVEPPCKDEIVDCEPYGTSMCYIPEQYGWVDANCRKFCGFCGNKTELQITTPPPTTAITTASICEDKIAKCDEFNADLCTNNAFIGWAKTNCPKYCGFCYNYKYVTSAVVNHVKCPAWTLPEHCTLEYTTPGQCCPSPKCPDGYRLTIERHLR